MCILCEWACVWTVFSNPFQVLQQQQQLLIVITWKPWVLFSKHVNTDFPLTGRNEWKNALDSIDRKMAWFTMFLLKQFWHQVLSLIHLWPDTHTLMSVYGGVKNEQHELNTIFRKHTSINDRKKNVQCMHALIKRSELCLNIIYAYINTWKNFESSFNCKSFWWVFFLNRNKIELLAWIVCVFVNYGRGFEKNACS